MFTLQKRAMFFSLSLICYCLWFKRNAVILDPYLKPTPIKEYLNIIQFLHVPPTRTTVLLVEEISWSTIWPWPKKIKVMKCALHCQRVVIFAFTSLHPFHPLPQKKKKRKKFKKDGSLIFHVNVMTHQLIF